MDQPRTAAVEPRRDGDEGVICVSLARFTRVSPGPTFRRVSEAKQTRVMIGMSGGVDSSAAAALLQAQGFDLVGVTLKLWPQDCVNRAEDKCCGPEAVKDARAVAHQLGIPYYLVDESAEFQKQVIAYFAEEYKAGRTPNPCVMCNERLKFGTLLHRADQLGAQLIATGHFARTEKCATTGRTLLKRGRGPCAARWCRIRCRHARQASVRGHPRCRRDVASRVSPFRGTSRSHCPARSRFPCSPPSLRS